MFCMRQRRTSWPWLGYYIINSKPSTTENNVTLQENNRWSYSKMSSEIERDRWQYFCRGEEEEWRYAEAWGQTDSHDWSCEWCRRQIETSTRQTLQKRKYSFKTNTTTIRKEDTVPREYSCWSKHRCDIKFSRDWTGKGNVEKGYIGFL